MVATTGLRRYQAATSASLSVIATGEDSSGYAAAVSRSWADIDAAAVAAEGHGEVPGIALAEGP